MYAFFFGCVYQLEACSAERMLVIVCMRSFLNYSEHCHLKASAREQSRVLALLNKSLVGDTQSLHYLNFIWKQFEVLSNDVVNTRFRNSSL
jgi:hypothetical protein